MAKKILASILALCLVLSTMGTLVFAETEWPTENWIDNPDTTWYEAGKSSYTISTAAELAGLAKLVNEGTAFHSDTFATVTITLADDIDLGGKMWTPIGTLGGDKSTKGGYYSFMGTFDGNEKIISNVIIYDENVSGKKYANIGLFGSIGKYGDGPKVTVKDLTVKNATVVSSNTSSHLGSNVAAVVGNGNASTVINNVHLKGNIEIVGYGYVGGIVGHGYPDMSNCSVEAEGTIRANMWCCGALVGYLGEGADVCDSSVKGTGETGLNLSSAMAGIGGAVGRTNGGNTKVENIAVENITIETPGYSEYGIGYVTSGGNTPTNSTVANVTVEVDGKTYNPDDANEITAVVAKIGDTYYETLQAAVDAATTGDTINVIGNASGEAVTVNKDLTITGNATLNNVSITASGTTVELTVTNLNFTGSSYINAGDAAALTVTGVTADVDPTMITGRAAFIVLGTSEPAHGLKLTVKDNVIKSAQGSKDPFSAALFGWRYIADGSEISGNTFGADSEEERYTFIAVKTMNAMDGAVFKIEENTVYGSTKSWNFKAFDLYQNCSSANNYTVLSKDNGISVKDADNGNYYCAFYIEGSKEGITNLIMLDNGTTLNGNAITMDDIAVSNKLTSYNKFYGINVTFNEDGKITGGTFCEKGNSLAENLAPGFVFDGNSNEVVAAKASFDGVAYLTLAEAIDAANKSVNDAEIKVTENISDEAVKISGNVKIVAAAPASTYSRAARANVITLNNVTFDVARGASLALDGFAVTGLSYIKAEAPESISVENCDIDVTVKDVGINCPPAFINFAGEIDNRRTELNFVNNNLSATSANAVTHGIAGWNYLGSAKVKNNTFGSESEPLSGAAVKLMNFVEGATVEVSGNTFYVNSKDSIWGPNALQLYQNCSRDNKYTATISDNDFYVDDATAAIGINSAGKGNGFVTVTADNTVNGEAISASDVIVFGNGINDAPAQGGYIGVGVATDASGKITGGVFDKNSEGLEAMLADGYAIETDVDGNLHVVEKTLLVDKVYVDFVEEEVNEDDGYIIYNVNLKGNNSEIINRLNSVDLTFAFSGTPFTGGNMAYEVLKVKDITVTTEAEYPNRYMFNFNGKDNVDDTANTITVAQIKVTGYGTFNLGVKGGVDTNIANATKLFDNIVDTFVTTGEAGKGVLDITDSINGEKINVPTRKLTVKVTFPNAVVDKDADYQNMKVEITGNIDGVNQTVTYNLGENTGANAAYVVEEDRLVLNDAYTVTVSGDGYRTARYTVTMTDNKTLNFWNNVRDNAAEVESGKSVSAVVKNFLAGDIVADNQINIYDLSAVVSYFTQKATEDAKYVKYDLNRDGVIDSKDVAYVLVSWGE